MFDDQLADNEYVAGDRFTNADITLCIAIDFARMVQVVPIPELANIERWHAQVSTRPSLAQG